MPGHLGRARTAAISYAAEQAMLRAADRQPLGLLDVIAGQGDPAGLPPCDRLAYLASWQVDHVTRPGSIRAAVASAAPPAASQAPVRSARRKLAAAILAVLGLTIGLASDPSAIAAVGVVAVLVMGSGLLALALFRPRQDNMTVNKYMDCVNNAFIEIKFATSVRAAEGEDHTAPSINGAPVTAGAGYGSGAVLTA